MPAGRRHRLLRQTAEGCTGWVTQHFRDSPMKPPRLFSPPLNLSVIASDSASLPHVASTPLAVSAQRMQALYQEIKTPYKAGVVLDAPAGKMVDCPNVFRHGSR